MNQLKVSTQQLIIALVQRGWSQRRISRELELDRETVARYVKLAAPKSALQLRYLGSTDCVMLLEREVQTLVTRLLTALVSRNVYNFG